MAVTNNTTMTTMRVNRLHQTGGDLTVSGNASVTTIDMGMLTGTGGDLTVSGNASATTIDMPALTNVGGNLDAEAMTSIVAVTADGSSELTLATAEASMTALLAMGTFASPAGFTVTRLDPLTLPPEAGESAGGAAAMIDPLAAYQFAFDIPTLGMQAALTFEIDVAALDAATQTAFLAALAADSAPWP